MNRIERIQALNLKGTTIDATLTALTAIIGPNAGGKTALANAVTIALLGHIPALGKQPGKTVQLMTAGAPMLDVQATLEDGQKINRRFDVRKAIKTTATGPDFSDAINPVQLDFDEFFKAKPTERQRILEGLLATSGDANVVTEVREKIAKAALTSAPQTAFNGDGWLQALEAELKDMARLTKQDLDTAAKTILSLQGEEKPPEYDAQAAADVESQLSTWREKLGQARQALDSISEAQQNAPDKPDGEEITEGQIAAAEAEMERLNNEISQAEQAVTEWRAANDEATRILAPHSGVERVEAKASPMTAEELTAGWAKLQQQRREYSTSLTRARTQLEAAEEAIENAKLRRDDLESRECCPTCGAKGDSYRASLQVEMATAISEAEAKARKAREDVTNYTEVQDALNETDAALKAKELERAQHAAFLAQVRADKLLEGKTDRRQDVEQLKIQARTANTTLTTLRREARQWIEWKAAKIPTEAAAEKANQDFKDAQARVTTLEQTKTLQEGVKRTAEAWLGNQTRLTAMTRENETRTSEIAALTELAGWVKAKSLELTAAAMKPLLGVCNGVLDGLVDGQIAIEGTVVGIQRGGALLPLEVLSGSEAVALSAAIQIAIAGKSPFRIVMIDELSRFSTERKRKFVSNLAFAILSGLVDQVLVFDHDGRTGNYAEEDGDIGSAVTVA